MPTPICTSVQGYNLWHQYVVGAITLQSGVIAELCCNFLSAKFRSVMDLIKLTALLNQGLLVISGITVNHQHTSPGTGLGYTLLKSALMQEK